MKLRIADGRRAVGERTRYKVIDAERVTKHFAIHRPCEDWRGFVVTHIPTGYRAGRKCFKRKKAVDYARALERAKVDWDFRNPRHMSKATKKAGGDISRRFFPLEYRLIAAVTK